jgi:hypothetical protein
MRSIKNQDTYYNNNRLRGQLKINIIILKTDYVFQSNLYFIFIPDN